MIWRCHVGIDTPSDLSRRAWEFLRPYVEPADAYVFSRKAFVWEGLDDDKINLIAPVIDAFSAKNQELDPDTVRAILHAAGLNEEDNGGQPHVLARGRHARPGGPPAPRCGRAGRCAPTTRWCSRSRAGTG